MTEEDGMGLSLRHGANSTDGGEWLAEPIVSAREFRETMRLVPAAVGVITTVHEGRRYGLTATAICSLSAEPPQLLICINRASSLHAPLAASRRLAVNFLSTDQSEVAKAFSIRGEDPELRFAAGRWGRNAAGLPTLADAVAVLECELVEDMPRASHSVFIGQVTSVATNDLAPLLYHSGQYRRLDGLQGANAGGAR
jgi:flavin reductase (DIM6/NTAB) family NADH-FMN oxidoreductase RutF